MKHIEHQHQVALIAWAHRVRLPEGADVEPGATIGFYLLAIPNGGSRAFKIRAGADGKEVRYSPEAARLKAEGVKPGVSDLMLPLRRDGFAGLWLELKAPGKRPTSDQTAWLRRMTLAGYRAEWRDSWTDAAAVIADYVGVQPPAGEIRHRP